MTGANPGTRKSIFGGTEQTSLIGPLPWESRIGRNPGMGIGRTGVTPVRRDDSVGTRRGRVAVGRGALAGWRQVGAVCTQRGAATQCSRDRVPRSGAVD